MSQQLLNENQATPIHSAEAVPSEVQQLPTFGVVRPDSPEASEKDVGVPAATDDSAKTTETAKSLLTECSNAVEGTVSAMDKETEAAGEEESKSQTPQCENSRRRGGAAADNEELDGAATKRPRLEENLRDSTDSTGVGAAVDAAATTQTKEDGLVKAESANGTQALDHMVEAQSQSCELILSP
ncbi:hypothetical protein TraAM80_02737 [Trypanosoma rangeli]|uniref:Uncharacterized protein n=1 Tax=Trypanosoma rangeli TaxID=5698 RepID=A0A422NSK3_TRYRA|nr:uncharacterized protein TraAM80_02737 [Trypanosoma rangeli]RNF08436.1 hypothetical protein TraAM80_02737 [Trypanosoma rangeli]|eukprot:RNF08436.1 hypothetical protein TraAM80_02737 [Trypanosoma rangeli]